MTYTTSIAWVALTTTALCAAQPGPTDKPKAEPDTQAPTIRLANPEGFEDQAGLIAATATRVAELTRQGKDEVDAVRRADMLLQAANLVLAHDLEPACSAKLLGN